MTKAPQSGLARALGVGLSALAALIAVTCASTGTIEHAPSAPKTGHAESVPSTPHPARVDPLPDPKTEPAGAASAAAPLEPPSPARLEFARLFADLTALEAKRRNEDRFLANLGVSPVTITILSMIPASIAEIAIGAWGPQ